MDDRQTDLPAHITHKGKKDGRGRGLGEEAPPTRVENEDGDGKGRGKEVSVDAEGVFNLQVSRYCKFVSSC